MGGGRAPAEGWRGQGVGGFGGKTGLKALEGKGHGENGFAAEAQRSRRNNSHDNGNNTRLASEPAKWGRRKGKRKLGNVYFHLRRHACKRRGRGTRHGPATAQDHGSQANWGRRPSDLAGAGGGGLESGCTGGGHGRDELLVEHYAGAAGFGSGAGQAARAKTDDHDQGGTED